MQPVDEPINKNTNKESQCWSKVDGLQKRMVNSPSVVLRFMVDGLVKLGYRRRKWTRRHKFKSWTRLIAFHIALIPLEKV